MIEYAVNSPALASLLAAHLRERGCEASSQGTHLWATHSRAADPSEERLILGGVIAAWRREHPEARINPTDFEPPAEMRERA